MCVHMWPFTMKFNMLGFVFLYIPLYHVHVKEDYMRKIILPANRPLHLLNLNYVVWLFI